LNGFGVSSTGESGSWQNKYANPSEYVLFFVIGTYDSDKILCKRDLSVELIAMESGHPNDSNCEAAFCRFQKSTAATAPCWYFTCTEGANDFMISDERCEVNNDDAWDIDEEEDDAEDDDEDMPDNPVNPRLPPPVMIELELLLLLLLLPPSPISDICNTADSEIALHNNARGPSSLSASFGSGSLL
jgi:hypothetical protein